MAILDFEQRIKDLDLSLFGGVFCQSDVDDQMSWLAVQRSIRQMWPRYVYLEIGSHLGGSLQQHLLDPFCLKIISIDKRPEWQPDDRGKPCLYPDNSTARMIENLRAIAPENISKIQCFDCDAKDIDVGEITTPVHICFIDGEHTRSAVLSDFEFCLKVCDKAGVICFHDARVIWPALGAIMASLRRRGYRFEAYKLPGETFAICFGNCPVMHDEFIVKSGMDARQFINMMRMRPLGGAARRLMPRKMYLVAKRVWNLFFLRKGG